MHVIAHRFETAGATAIDNQGLVPAAEKVPEKLVSQIESMRVDTQQPLHSLDQIRQGCLDHQMKVIGHQAKTVHLPGRLLAALLQGLKEPLPDLVVSEDAFLMISTAHHV